MASELAPPNKRSTIAATHYLRTLNVGDVVVAGGVQLEVVSVQGKRQRTGIVFKVADGCKFDVIRRGDRDQHPEVFNRR